MPLDYDSLTKEELIRRLEEATRPPSLGLYWERNRIEHDQALNDDFIALDLDRELSCGAAPFENLIIEGDNFDALRLLRLTHAGKIKCIYIDPPYNTGRRDFVYNDRFVDPEDQFRHSTWLEFMYRRLLLARELLSEDGALFVSIDDNEVFHLGLLLNKVFGERNHIATVIWQKVYAPKNTALHFSDDHEYILVYAADRDEWRPNPLPRSEKQTQSYKNPDDDPRGPWRADNFSARNPYSAGIYPITCPSGRVIPGPPKGTYWRVSEAKFKAMDADNRIWWGKDGNNVPAIKRFLSEVKEGVIPQTLWTYQEVGHTQDAKKEIVDILEFEDSAAVFSTPKPLRLMERILRIATRPGDIALDFFAGSGTLAHALLKLNREDDAGRREPGRRFILVSNTEALPEHPDKNLCRDVCAERLRRAIDGYTGTRGKAVEGLGGDFAYLRTRRIEAGELAFELEHLEAWTLIQLLQGLAIAPHDPDTPAPLRTDCDPAIAYLPRVDQATLGHVAEALGPAGGTVYTWQAGLVEQHLTDTRLAVVSLPDVLEPFFHNQRVLA